jgi:hypothetical protein
MMQGDADMTVALFDNNVRIVVGLRLQVIDIPNSMTVLPELIPYSIEMVSRG